MAKTLDSAVKAELRRMGVTGEPSKLEILTASLNLKRADLAASNAKATEARRARTSATTALPVVKLPGDLPDDGEK